MRMAQHAQDLSCIPRLLTDSRQPIKMLSLQTLTASAIALLVALASARGPEPVGVSLYLSKLYDASFAS
jgi:hypothetical protein